MTPALIAIRRVAKHFRLPGERKLAGFSTSGAGALIDVVRKVLRPSSDGNPDDRTLVALHDISFEVQPGEVVGILGRNGAGKSTLLKILARVLHPTSGEVTVRGRMIPLLELGMGFAAELSVVENIRILGHMAGLPAREIASLEPAIVKAAGLEEFRDVPLEACPSGSFVQLVFAALINIPADVILADEVLTVGDAAFRQAVERHLHDVAARGGAVLFVSHDLATMRRVCTRIVWIDQGLVRLSGEPDGVIAAYSAALMAGADDEDGETGELRLFDLRLLGPEGEQVGALQMTDPGQVEARIATQAYGGPIEVLLELWQHGVHVTTARSGQRDVQPGQHITSRTTIPGDLLNEGAYEVVCRVFTGDFTTGLLPAAVDRLSVNVFNPNPTSSVWSDWRWGKAGLISPKARWTLGEVSETPDARSAACPT